MSNESQYWGIKFTDEDVVNKDSFIPKGEYNPHNVRPWLLHDHGFVLAVVFADCLQDAIDEAVDADKLDRYLLDPTDKYTQSDYMHEVEPEHGYRVEKGDGGLQEMETVNAIHAWLDDNLDRPDGRLKLADAWRDLGEEATADGWIWMAENKLWPTFSKSLAKDKEIPPWTWHTGPKPLYLALPESRIPDDLMMFLTTHDSSDWSRKGWVEMEGHATNTPWAWYWTRRKAEEVLCEAFVKYVSQHGHPILTWKEAECPK